MVKRLMTLGIASCLAACGGDSGGGSSSGPATPANAAPSFTSAGVATVTENNSGVVYTAVASDPEGTSVTYSIGGGPDAAAFAITAAGALSFVAAPDFERPSDTDGNNVYRVQINASDGTTSTALTVDVTVSNTPDVISVRRVATGFDRPLALTAYPDGSGRVAVVEKTGRVRLLDVVTGVAVPFLDVTAEVSTTVDRGLLGLAFAPDFATSRLFYVFMNNTAGAIEIRRYQAQSEAAIAVPTSGQVVMTFTLPSATHQGGWIAFGPDNYLYIGTGDGVANRTDANDAGSGATFRGKLLRIDPSKDDFPADPSKNYSIPADNPVATYNAPEIWAIGLRNLNHASFDPVTKDLWFGDTGQDFQEEIDRLLNGQVPKLAGMGPPPGVRTSFGWNDFEGTRVVAPRPGITSCCQNPIYEYDHGTGALQGSSVIGGYVYRGPVVPLQSQYIFADGAVPNIWSFSLADVPVGAGVQGTPTIPTTAIKQRNADFAPNMGSFTAISGFGTDASGNLFIMDGDGEIFVIEGR